MPWQRRKQGSPSNYRLRIPPQATAPLLLRGAGSTVSLPPTFELIPEPPSDPTNFAFDSGRFDIDVFTEFLEGTTSILLRDASSTIFVGSSFEPILEDLPTTTSILLRDASSTVTVAPSFEPILEDLPTTTSVLLRDASSGVTVAPSFDIVSIDPPVAETFTLDTGRFDIDVFTEFLEGTTSILTRDASGTVNMAETFVVVT
jgi:hypothetical protein